VQMNKQRAILLAVLGVAVVALVVRYLLWL
jgi:hypothetical protein